MKYAESQWDVTKSFSQINLTGKFKPYERSVIFHKIVLPWNLLAGINTSNADFFRPKWCEREAKNLWVLRNSCNYTHKEHDFFKEILLFWQTSHVVRKKLHGILLIVYSTNSQTSRAAELLPKHKHLEFSKFPSNKERSKASNLPKITFPRSWAKNNRCSQKTLLV